MSDKMITISVSDNLKDSASKILYRYRDLWLQLLSLDKYEPIEWGLDIVKALDSAYKNYGGLEKYFISDWFGFDFIKSFGDEKWFHSLLAGNRVPFECVPRCLHGSGMIAELIYGGIPDKFPLAQVAKQNGLTEEEGEKLYNEFWQKAIAVLREKYGDII